LIKEKKRKGKATAINKALKKITSPIIVLQSADTIPSGDLLKNLLEPFKHPKVGMVCGRPVPLDNKNTFTGFVIHLIWFLHHLISLEKPKAGEIIAFRNVIKKLPERLVADESYLELNIIKRGFEVVYVPTAVVFNKGPQHLVSLLEQRKRVFLGHLHIKKCIIILFQP